MPNRDKAQPAGGNPAGLTMGGAFGTCAPHAFSITQPAVIRNLGDLAGLSLDRAAVALDLGNLDAARRHLEIAGSALQIGAGDTFQAARRRLLLVQARYYQAAHGGGNGAD